MLTEAQACTILKRIFESRGFSIQENILFAEEEVSFTADGWDPAARVGYEFLSHEAGDHEDLSPEEIRTLGTWIESGRVYFFIIDEKQVADEAELAWAANAFLDEVARRRGNGAAT